MGKAKVIIYVVVFFIVAFTIFSLYYDPIPMEVERISKAIYVDDGDTFTIETGEEIRLADINTPEEGYEGYSKAKNVLSLILGDRTVYLDIDDYERTDKYGRLVCVAYIDNGTHYMNVNKFLLDYNLANIWDHSNNEFNPEEWTLLIPKDIMKEFLMTLTFSILGGMWSILILDTIVKKMQRK
jgi:hypothetical protein